MREIRETIGAFSLTLETENTLFSPGQIDLGTRYMLEEATLKSGMRVLDLGCGYGAAGIYAAKIVGAQNVVMADVDEIAVHLAKQNAVKNDVAGIEIYCSDGFRDMPQQIFDVILSNPPYHTDFSVAKHFIEAGFSYLAVGGRFYMVTRRLEWYRNKLKAVFGGVRVTEKEGYYIFTAEKRHEKPFPKEAKSKPTLSKKLQRKAEKRSKL
ncbi:MAG: class I SAM-dependent methyltransferase [Christensenellaceae bacterium]|jgi:16S rRNA (guanine1207-N2)-methyltransferase